MSYNDLRKGRVSEYGREYFITFVVYKRVPVFSDFRSARLFIENLHHGIEGEWLSWVLMPDHFHGLFRLDGNDLSREMNRVKGRSARALNKSLRDSGRFWQTGFFDHALRKEEDRLSIARYIVANPLRAGLVENIGQYSHWDSVWL